ncbi:MAG: FAD:protein FMN transferase [Bacteroidales bacterium]|nr:FAD:protein FMN transferase [Bacteroidales bacterium]
MKSIYFFIVSLLLLLASGCRQQEGPVHFEGKAQGTYYSITYYDEQNRNFQESIDSLLDDFDLTASLWVDNSLLRRVNENRDSIVNTYFYMLVEMSREIHDRTGGAFDCTVGKLVNAWGFGFEKKSEMSDKTIDSLLNYVGKQPEIVIDSNGTLIVRKACPESFIDFNAIAQGFSTDLVSYFLEKKGIENFLVDIGGEIIARGHKANGSPWIVGIEKPASNKYSSPEIELKIELSDMAVVTSGNYRKYYEKEGVRYSHTIDPTTGRPVEHTLLSVSVVDSTAWLADAMATAYMVMGLERSKQFIAEHPGIPGTKEVFFIYNENGEYKTYSTAAFNERVQKGKK